MRVVGISASPRRSGNSEILLDRALEGAAIAGASVEKIVLNELSYKPCQECGGCDKSGICVIHDGMEHVYRELDKADAVILSSPIFFDSLSAQAKMMIDRFQCSWTSKYVLKNIFISKKRRGMFICTAGSAGKAHFLNAKKIVRAFFATLDIEYFGELFCGELEKMDDVYRDEKNLNRAYALGDELVKL